MDQALVWRELLINWPTDITRSGVIVTDFEQIGFVEFLLNEHVGIFERRAPDTVGARKVLIPYAEIRAIKICDPSNDDTFEAIGFRGPKKEVA